MKIGPYDERKHLIIHPLKKSDWFDFKRLVKKSGRKMNHYVTEKFYEMLDELKEEDRL